MTCRKLSEVTEYVGFSAEKALQDKPLIEHSRCEDFCTFCKQTADETITSQTLPKEGLYSSTA